MQAIRSAAKRLAILIAPVLLAACSILQPGGNEVPAASLKRLVENVPRVDNSPASPCWQQEQIAAQNAYLDAQLRGKAKPYVAPCKTKPAAEPKPQIPAPNLQPKTS